MTDHRCVFCVSKKRRFAFKLPLPGHVLTRLFAFGGPPPFSFPFSLLFSKGLADAFIKMRLPFESEEASKLNRDIFETIYFGAVNASVEVITPLAPRGVLAV